MCGICGTVGRHERPDAEAIRRMQAALVQRGPDEAGDHFDRAAGMAHRRLSIIDLGGGRQPLYDEARSLVLIANGEIYNHVELRRELEGRGHRFATRSDNEVIVHLYEELGPDCVHRLRGMFAFALWDAPRRRLLLARDRMGEKPLYLYESDQGVFFASELRALLASGAVPFELDPHAVDLFFHYQYVPEPHTPVRGVRKLPAGSLLTIDVDPWRVEERRYWRMADAPPLEGDPVARIREELHTVADLVIRADVPVGVALSGGLDSSAIAALAAARYGESLQTFSVGYPGRPPGDERADAEALARHLGLPFHDIELSTPDMVSFFPELVVQRDDPIADLSGYGYYAVMRLAADHGVPVVLQGQGGDELFWGYPWVREALEQTRRKAALRSGGGVGLRDYLEPRRPPAPWHPRAFYWWLQSAGGLAEGVRRYRRDRRDPADRLVFYDIAPDFPMAHRSLGSLYHPRFRELVRADAAFDFFTVPEPRPSPDLLMTELICGSYLLENGIAQGDRLSMASSVELRLPLVDYRLVETVIGLRKAQPDSHLPPKHWLREAVRDVLPEWVLGRRKQGFAPPIDHWHASLFRAYGDRLDGGLLVERNVLRPQAGRKLAGGPFPRDAVAPVSMKALVLEMWAGGMETVARNARGADVGRVLAASSC